MKEEKEILEHFAGVVSTAYFLNIMIIMLLDMKVKIVKKSHLYIFLLSHLV